MSIISSFGQFGLQLDVQLSYSDLVEADSISLMSQGSATCKASALVIGPFPNHLLSSSARRGFVFANKSRSILSSRPELEISFNASSNSHIALKSPSKALIASYFDIGLSPNFLQSSSANHWLFLSSLTRSIVSSFKELFIESSSS
jgi:hypothetical protein